MAVKTYKLPGIGPGMPDYTTQQPGTQRVGPLSTLADMAELAARLNSIVSFDRRGNVIFADDFENNLKKWESSISPFSAGRLSLSTDRARSGSLSCKQITGVDASDYAGIIRRMSYPYQSRIGLEASCSLGTGNSYFYLSFTQYDGANNKTGMVRYNEVDDKLEYWTSAGAWAELKTGLRLSVGSVFHTFKLVIEPSTNLYLRLLVNNNEYDMSALALDVNADTTAARLDAELRSVAGVAAAQTNYVDDAIITVAEPANLA